MEPSLWQHQTIEPITGPAPRDTTAQAFASGVLVGIVRLPQCSCGNHPDRCPGPGAGGRPS